VKHPAAPDEDEEQKPAPVYREDRPLNIGNNNSELAEYGDGSDLPWPEELSAVIMKEQQDVIEMFDQHTVQCLFSKQWVLRENALKKMAAEVQKRSPPAHFDKSVFTILSKVLAMALEDKVAKVFEEACNLLEAVVDQYAKDAASPSTVTSALNQPVDILLSALGGSNARSRKTAHRIVLFLAEHKNVESAGPIMRIFRPLKKKEIGKPLPLKGRATLLLELVEAKGLDKGSGLTLGEVMDFATPHVDHRDKAVRDSMVDLVVACQKIVGTKAVGPFMKNMEPRIVDTIAANFDDKGAALQAFSSPAARQQQQGGGNKAKKGGAGKDMQQDVGEESATGFCQFCGVEDPSFTEEKLDMHYWQSCPMLTSCAQCEQVIEIPTINEHLLEECEVQGTYKQCKNCKEPIAVNVYDSHVQAKNCKRALPATKGSRCPLCKKDIAPGEEGWRKHLLEEGCPKNPRKLYG